MNIQLLQALVIDALEDVKAQDIVLFDTTGMSNLFDRLVVASGTSNRQTRALATSVHDKVKAAGGQVLGMEGGDTGEWVLVDLGDMVVHIMQAPIRAYYRLEELWGEKPISLEEARKGLKTAKATKKSTKEEAAESADATAPGPLTLTKPKRASRRNDSAVEALQPEPKPRKSRSKAAAEAVAEAPAATPVKRTRKAPAAPAANSAAESAAKPVKRVRAAKAISATEGAAKPAARPRKPRAAE